MTTDLLEERLQKLAAGAPDAGRVMARVLAAAPRPRRPVWPRLSLSAVATAVLIVLVLYFVPASGTVVARIPIAGEAFGANAHVTVVGSSSTSSGYTLTLTGAFADSARTVLYVHSSPAIAFLGMDTVITDQFGRSYHSANSSSNTLAGDLVAQFDALAWPDQLTGARIALNVSAVQIGVDNRDIVRGAWRMTAIVGVDEGTSVVPPQPVTIAGARFTFTSVTYTPETIAIDIDMSGATSDDTARPMPFDPSNPKGMPVLSFDVLAPDGRPAGGSSEIDDGVFGVSYVHMLADRGDVGAGLFTIRITYMGQSVERIVAVS